MYSTTKTQYSDGITISVNRRDSLIREDGQKVVCLTCGKSDMIQIEIFKLEHDSKYIFHCATCNRAVR